MAAPPTTRAQTRWSVDRAVSLLEVWALVAAFSGLVGAWRLMGVCRAARAGAKEWLGTLPGLVVCGGIIGGGVISREVRRLNLATMRWRAMPMLVAARSEHVCCVVRGALVVLGGGHVPHVYTSSVERLSERGEFVELPPLSCGWISYAATIAVEEMNSSAGQVLLLGGLAQLGETGIVSTVQLVDLDTGVCTPQPALLHARFHSAAAGMPDGRIVRAGGFGDGDVHSTAEMWAPPAHKAVGAAWGWRSLPAMSVERRGCCGCVMSGGRFAVLGGVLGDNATTSSCEALVVGATEQWEALPPMHESRYGFACVAVARCILVAGGYRRTTGEVYDEVLGRWLRLPYDLPHTGGLWLTGSTLL